MTNGIPVAPEHPRHSGRGGPGREPRNPRAWVLPGILLVLGTVGFVAIYLVAVRTYAGQELDNWLMHSSEPETFEVRQQLRVVHDYFGPATLGLACAVLALIGLRRSVSTFLAVGASTVFCALAAQLLKVSLGRPQLADLWPMSNSLPSGHVAGVAAVGVALLLVVPRFLLAPAALLALVGTAGMGMLVVMLQHHRPSDVLASLCVALVGLAIGLLVRSSPGPFPPQTVRSNTAASP